MPPEDNITISIEEYERLKKDSAWLGALEQAGVDNWEGYDFAREIYAESHSDDDDEGEE